MFVCMCVELEVLWGGLQEMTTFNDTGYAVETVYERQLGILWNVNSCIMAEDHVIYSD